MNRYFAAHISLRESLLHILKNTSHKDLVTIPDGFNNNIYWNIAHCVATQQLLHYYLSNNPFRIDKYWIDRYKKGSFANFDVEPSEVEDLQYLLIETSKILANDYANGYFSEYNHYKTSTGAELKNIEDAIFYNNMHESQHYGFVLALKKLINSSGY